MLIRSPEHLPDCCPSSLGCSAATASTVSETDASSQLASQVNVRRLSWGNALVVTTDTEAETYDESEDQKELESILNQLHKKTFIPCGSDS